MLCYPLSVAPLFCPVGPPYRDRGRAEEHSWSTAESPHRPPAKLLAGRVARCLRSATRRFFHTPTCFPGSPKRVRAPPQATGFSLRRLGLGWLRYQVVVPRMRKGNGRAGGTMNRFVAGVTSCLLAGHETDCALGRPQSPTPITARVLAEFHDA